MDAATSIKQKMVDPACSSTKTSTSRGNNNLLPGLLWRKQLRCGRDVKFAWHSNEFLPLFNRFDSHQARNVQRWYLEANADEKTEEYEIFKMRCITEMLSSIHTEFLTQPRFIFGLTSQHAKGRAVPCQQITCGETDWFGKVHYSPPDPTLAKRTQCLQDTAHGSIDESSA